MSTFKTDSKTISFVHFLSNATIKSYGSFNVKLVELHIVIHYFRHPYIIDILTLINNIHFES
jgi:hypothetical protein